MRFLALVLIALLFSAAPAHAGFMAGIVSAVGSAFAAIKGSAIGSALLQIALSAGMSLLSRLLQRRQRDPGIQTRHTTTGGTDPQGFILGIYPSGGHLVYKNSHGQRNRYINYVIEVSDIPGVDLSRLIIDGEYSDLGETAHPDYGFPILTKRKDGGADRGWIKWHDGTQTGADPMLVSRYSDESTDGTYSEGTISGEAGTTTITGSGTLWTQLPIIGEGGAGAWEIILPNGQREKFTVVNDTTIELANAYWTVEGQSTTFSGESYEMVAANWQSNDDERPWTADHIGTGIAYAVLTFRLDRDVFDREPDVRFELRGIALYDPRKDSTVGGSGAHRWDDPATWEFTENPAVMLYNIHRGITTPTGEVWGYGAEAEDLPLDWWVPAMNACDDLVGNDDRTQYVAGFEVRFEDEPAEVCEQLEAACNAQVAELGGVWTIRVGAPGPAVLSITDDDILIDESQQFEPFPGLESIHNGVTITHPSPSSLWSGREAEPILNEDWEDEDGTRRVADLRLPAVASAEQANQIGWALLRKERRFRTHAITLPPEYAALDLLDVIEWSSPWHGYQDEEFEIQEVARDLSTLRVRVSLRDVDPTDDAFDPDFELPEPPLPITVIPRVEARIPGWRVQPTAITDAAGENRRPGILITWDGEEAATSGDDMVEVEVRVQATGAVDYNEAVRASSGRDVVEALPVTAYEVRGRLITSDDTGEWTVWTPVPTLDLRLGEADFDDEFNSRVNDLRSDADQLITDVAQANQDLGDVNAYLDSIEIDIATAEQVVSEAEASRDAAQAFRDASQAARDASQLARDEAQTHATNADGSAMAASGHAQTAETKANEAGQSATAAQAFSVVADTSGALIKNGRFEDGVRPLGESPVHWTEQWPSTWQIVERDPNAGASAVQNAPSQFMVRMDPSGFTWSEAYRGPATEGDYFTVEWQYAWGGASQDGDMQIRIQATDANGNPIDTYFLTYQNAGTSWTKVVEEAGPFPQNTVEVNIRLRTNGITAGRAYVTNIEARKTTDVRAASDSAQSASVSAGDAETSAAAATTAKNEAETARGQAQTFRDEAATSATTAESASSTASTQAGIATTAANDAGDSASAAASSESAAFSHSDDAGQHAAAANQSKLDAETANTNAGIARDEAVSAKQDSEGAASSAASRVGLISRLEGGQLVANPNFEPDDPNNPPASGQPPPLWADAGSGWPSAWSVIEKGATGDSAVQNAPSQWLVSMDPSGFDQATGAYGSAEEGEQIELVFRYATGGSVRNSDIVPRVRWFDDDGIQIGASTMGVSGANSTSWNTHREVSPPAPAGTRGYRVDLRVDEVNEGRAYVDYFSARKLDSVTQDAKATADTALTTAVNNELSFAQAESDIEAHFNDWGSFASQSATAVATADTLAARQYLGVTAGDETASLELVAYDGEQGSGSAVKFSAGNILFTGTVGANELVVTDLTGNIIPDGKFRFGDARGISTNLSNNYFIKDSRDGGSSLFNGDQPARFSLSAPEETAKGVNSITLLDDFDVEGGQTFSWSFYIGTSEGSPRRGRWQLIFRYDDEHGNRLSNDFNSRVATDLSWDYHEGTSTAPTGAVKLQIQVRRLESSSSPDIGTSYITGLEVIKKRAGATVIQPEGITTPLLAAGAVTADKMSVGSLDAVSATIGTFRSNNSPDERIVIEDDRISVFDSNNNLRVRIGRL